MTNDGTREFTTMPRRKGLQIPLAPDERNLLSARGSWREHVRSGWRMGTLHLTNTRILFSIQTGVDWEILLSNIHTLAVEKQKYIGGGVKDVVVVTYRQPASKKVWVACLITQLPKDFEIFRKELFELVSPDLDEDTLEAVLGELNPRGRAIVEHLWDSGHATTTELAAALGVPSYMDVLSEIRDQINPTAQEIIGRSLLVAERATVDEGTAEKVLSSWWLVRPGGEGKEESGQSLVDIFDEGDHVDILVELADVREEDILLGVSERGVVVSARGADGPYREDIPLPPGVNTDKVSKTYRDDMLVISLQKLEG